MKLSQFLILLTVSFLFVYCTKDETLVDQPFEDTNLEPEAGSEEPESPTPIVYFTYEIGSNINTKDTNDFILIHDNKGKLLDFKTYESNQILVFEALKDSLTETISITKLHAQIGNGYESFGFETNVEVVQESVWKSTNSYLAPESVGTFNLIIDNIPEISQYYIKTRFGQISVANEIMNMNDGKALVLNGIDIMAQEEYSISILDMDKNLRHLFFNAPLDGETVSFDYKDLMDYDSYLDVDLPSNSQHLCSVIGFITDFSRDAKNTFETSLDMNFGQLEPSAFARLGYLDKYENQWTRFFSRTDDYTYLYQKVGGRPDKITVAPKPEIIIKEGSMTNLSFTTSTDYFTKGVRWSRTQETGSGEDYFYSYISWSIISPADSGPVIFELPLALKEAYPQIDLEELVLDNITLYTQGHPYQTYLKYQFEEPEQHREGEYESLSIDFNVKNAKMNLKPQRYANDLAPNFKFH